MHGEKYLHSHIVPLGEGLLHTRISSHSYSRQHWHVGKGLHNQMKLGWSTELDVLGLEHWVGRTHLKELGWSIDKVYSA